MSTGLPEKNLLSGGKSVDTGAGSAIIMRSRVPVYYTERLLVEAWSTGSVYAVVTRLHRMEVT